MTMTHGRKDKGAIPEANRKIRPTGVTRGGKAFAVEERQLQMELFAKPAEAKPVVPNTKSLAGEERDTTRISISQSPVPMFANKTKGELSAEMESICGRLDSALARVVSNRGAAGPNHQTVMEVKANWGRIKPKLIQDLQGGVYHPGDIRRVWIPKAGGGERGLGIPNVIDRVVQEAIREVLEPRYERKFHASSHGFRPKRSCHSAIAEAKGYLKEGYTIVVDIDLKDFFNRVHHQRLIATLRRDVKDARVITLIHRMLKAKVVMPDGVRVNNEEGVPQGGPLSPLLSNIVLDELDKELSRRGLRFVRYADDCNIYVKCMRSGERVMASIKRFIEQRLRLSVNEAKSAVSKPRERHFLGFSLNRKEDGEVEINLSQRSKQRLFKRVKELTPRNRGASINSVIAEINVYLKGWAGFFGICTECVERTLRSVDAHTRRRLRAMTLKQKKRKRFILSYLVKMGAKKERAGKQIYKGRKSLWQLSHTPVVELILNNAYWAKQGLLSSASLWKTRSEKIKSSASEQISFCWD